MPRPTPTSTVRCLLGSLLPVGMAAMATIAAAGELTLPPALCGHDERVDGGGACASESSFTAGVASPDLHLKVGGEAWGCNAEWASSFEFDLAALPDGSEVHAATLVVRKTGYSDDSQGFAYLGAYAYEPSGAAVSIERDDLTPDTALAIVYPTAANTDLVFDVTAAVQAWARVGAERAGLLVAPVYSEVGYEDWISIGGCGYAVAPRLVILHEGAVRDTPTSWSFLKATYR